MFRLLAITLLTFTLTAASALAGVKPAATLPANAKCPVCGMFVAKYPDWSATARFKDGTTYYYDGPKDLFSHYLDTGRYTPGRRQADIAALSVKEYYSLEPLDPRIAFFVIGSDVSGPMGSELIPFRNEQDAHSFKLDHKGKKIIRFKEVTLQLIKSLR